MKRLLRFAGIALGIFLLLLLIPLIGVALECKPFDAGDPAKQAAAAKPATMPGEAENAKRAPIDYERAEEQTYLTLPEWYIVYSTDEYAAFIQKNPPSHFPYFQTIQQYWQSYYGVCTVTHEQYPFNSGYHQMLVVIGVSFTAENVIKGVYENTLGRVNEWISSSELTEEDAYARKVAQEYGDFMHNIPWFEFPFRQKLIGLWTETSWWGPNPIRKWERKSVLTLEYGVKAIYGAALAQVTHSAFPPDKLEIRVGIEGLAEQTLKQESQVRIEKMIDAQSAIIILPRYEPFTQIIPRLAKQGGQFVSIAGNDEILLTAIAPSSWSYHLANGEFLFAMPILAQPDRQRVVVKVPVKELSLVLNVLASQGITIEHIYDY